MSPVSAVNLAHSSDRDEWNRFVEENGGTIYHTFEWRDFLERVSSYVPYYMYVKKEGSIRAACPIFLVKSRIFGNRLISVPYADKVGILGEPAFGKEILAEVTKLGKQLNVKSIEMHNLSQKYSPADSGFFKPWEYPSFLINLLPGEEKIFENLTKYLRKNIRRAKKSGVVTREIKTGGDMKKFYECHKLNMHELGTPPLPFKFFNELFNVFYPKYLGGYLAEYGNKTIAGLILFFYNEGVIAYSGLSKPEYKHLNGLSLIFWEAIKNNCKKFKYFDFGTSRPNSGNFEFKRKWGGTIEQVDWYYKFYKHPNIIDPRTKKYAIYSKLWGALPVPLCNLIGPYIRMSMGR